MVQIYKDVLLRHCLVVVLVIVTSCSSSDTNQNGTTVVHNRGVKQTGWWPIVQCVFMNDVNKCLQDRSVRAIVGLDRKDDIRIDTEKETVKLPGEAEAGIFEMLGDIVTDGISRFFQDDDDKKNGGNGEVDEDDDDDEEEDDDEETDDNQLSETGDKNKVAHGLNKPVSGAANVHRSVETGRGKKKKKKKKKKEIRRLIIKIIIVIVLVKLKIFKFIFLLTKFFQYKFVVMITINTIVNVLRFIMEWKRKKDADKVVYSYEHAHHQHHYDEQHHVDPFVDDEDKGFLGGLLWSRSGTYDDGTGVTHAHDMAYSAQKPALKSPNYTQRPAHYTEKPAQNAPYYTQIPAQNYHFYTPKPAVNSPQKPPQNTAYYAQKPAQDTTYYAQNNNGQRSI